MATEVIDQPTQSNRDAGDVHAHNGEHAHEETIPKDLKQPRTLTVIIATLLFVLLLAALFVVGFIPHRNSIAEAQADASERQNEVPTVSFMYPTATPSTMEISLTGDLKANQETALFPRASGYLKTLKVDIGDHVQAGQLLAEIEAPEIDAQLAQSRGTLEQAKANVVKAQSDFDLAQRTLVRYEDWAKQNTGGVTEQQLDEKRSAQSQAAGALAAAKANVVAAEADVLQFSTLQSFQKVTAPFAGMISARGYDVGALFTSNNANRELFHLIQTDPMRVFVNVPQAFATNLKVGSPAKLTVRNYPGREFQGTVARTAGALSENTRTMSVEIHFPNKDGELYSGMYGQIRLSVGDLKPVLIIPSSAVVFDAEGLRVAIVKDKAVTFQKITVGRDLGTSMEVIDGLSPQDAVVTNPGIRLADGIEVNAVPMKQPANAQGVDAASKKAVARE